MDSSPSGKDALLQRLNDTPERQIERAVDKLSDTFARRLDRNATATEELAKVTARVFYIAVAALVLCGVAAVLSALLFHRALETITETRTITLTSTSELKRIAVYLHDQKASAVTIHDWIGPAFDSGKANIARCDPNSFKSATGEQNPVRFLEQHRKNGAKALVLVLGAADNQRLSVDLSKSVDSNSHLAQLRAHCIRSKLEMDLGIDKVQDPNITVVDLSHAATSIEKDEGTRTENRRSRIVIAVSGEALGDVRH